MKEMAFGAEGHSVLRRWDVFAIRGRAVIGVAEDSLRSLPSCRSGLDGVEWW